MKYNPFLRLDVPKMLERLGIKARPVGADRFTATCPNPNHLDKSPSWFIRNIAGQQYHACHHCSACGWAGGPLILASTILGLNQEEAREWLLDLTAPPPIPTRIEEEIRKVPRKSSFKLPSCFQFAPLDEWPEEHLEYTLKRITEEQIVEWGLGFITKCKCENQRHKHRIAIPVRNELGQALSYTSRLVEKVPNKKSLRYVEPKKNEGAKRILFGQQKWNKGYEYLVVVEGIFDALAIEQLTDGLAVAALRGSSPRPTELSRISKFKGVIVVTDSDGAGRKARNEIYAGCSRHTNLVDLIMPEKVDPSKIIETEDGRKKMCEMLGESIHKVVSV